MDAVCVRRVQHLDVCAALLQLWEHKCLSSESVSAV